MGFLHFEQPGGGVFLRIRFPLLSSDGGERLKLLTVSNVF
jgi:hypothetical protein